MDATFSIDLLMTLYPQAVTVTVYDLCVFHRERDLSSKVIIHMEGNKTSIVNVKVNHLLLSDTSNINIK